MEKAVVEHLRRVVLDNLPAHALEVVAFCPQALGLSDGDAVDVVHDHDVLGAELQVRARAGDAALALVEGVEVIEVARLHEEVRLLAEGLPELFHHGLEIDELVGFHKTGGVTHDRAHDVDVLRHDLLCAGTLDLDGHVLARGEAGAVHLRERGASQGLGVDRVEDVAQGVPVLGLEPLEHHLVGHRVDIRAQAAQLVAEALGQDLRAIRQDLPHLHEHGAELLDQAAQAHRRDVVPDLVLAREADDLGYALAAALGG